METKETFATDENNGTYEATESLPYLLRDDFLSPAEKNFYQVLTSVVGDHLLIFSKVSLADLFFVSKPNENMSAINRINRKHVDFLLCEPGTIRPLFAIELDDSSHNRQDRVERDNFVNEVFATAGLPLFHMPVKPGYSAAEVEQILGQVVKTQINSETTQLESSKHEISMSPTLEQAPLCPECGVPMVLRTARTGEQAGKKFYGCVNYLKCRAILQI